MKHNSLVEEELSELNFFCDIIIQRHWYKTQQMFVYFSPIRTSIIRLEYECVCNFIKIALSKSTFTLA